MIEAQLAVVSEFDILYRLQKLASQQIRKYPETNDRRRIIEAELLADLAYVEETMTGVFIS
jgi:hypothetical protein